MNTFTGKYPVIVNGFYCTNPFTITGMKCVTIFAVIYITVFLKNSCVGELGFDEPAVGELGVGELGVGELGVGELGVGEPAVDELSVGEPACR